VKGREGKGKTKERQGWKGKERQGWKGKETMESEEGFLLFLFLFFASATFQFTTGKRQKGQKNLMKMNRKNRK